MNVGKAIKKRPYKITIINAYQINTIKVIACCNDGTGRWSILYEQSRRMLFCVFP